MKFDCIGCFCPNFVYTVKHWAELFNNSDAVKPRLSDHQIRKYVGHYMEAINLMQVVLFFPYYFQSHLASTYLRGHQVDHILYDCLRQV